MDATCNVQDSIHVFHLVHNMCPGFWVHIKLVQALRGFFVYGARTNGLALPFFICGTSDRIGKLDPWSHECPVCEERSYLRLST